MGVARARARLDVLSRAASRIAELWATPNRAPDVDMRLYQMFVNLTDREYARGVSLAELLARLPKDMAWGIRQSLADHLRQLGNGNEEP